MKKKSIKKTGRVYSFKGMFDRILGSLSESIEDNTEDLIKNSGDFVFLKFVLKKQMLYFIFSFVGILLFLMGLGLMINDVFPLVKVWMSYIVLGVLFYLVGLICKRLRLK